MRQDDELTTGEVVNGKHAQLWRDGTDKETRALDKMSGQVLVDPPRDEKILHTKYALRRK